MERFEIFINICKTNEFALSRDFESWLMTHQFFTAPASTKYHGAYEGGLFDHSFAVYKRLEMLTQNNDLEWSRKQSPFIIGMFHDLCKCDQYISIVKTEYVNMDGRLNATDKIVGYEYNKNTILKGHATKSIMLLSRFVNLTEEELLCIRFHMGAFETDDWDEFGKAIKMYPNVLWTHHADMLASKVDDI